MNKYQTAIGLLNDILADTNQSQYTNVRRRAEIIIERILPEYIPKHWKKSAHFKFNSNHKTDEQKVVRLKLAIKDAIHAIEVENKLSFTANKSESRTPWYKRTKWIMAIIGAVIVPIVISIYNKSSDKPKINNEIGKDQINASNDVNITNIYGDTSIERPKRPTPDKKDSKVKSSSPLVRPTIDLCEEYPFIRVSSHDMGKLTTYQLNICCYGSSAHKVKITYYIMMRKRIHDMDFILPTRVNDSSKLKIEREVIQKTEEIRTRVTVLNESVDNQLLLAYYVASRGTFLDENGDLHNSFTVKKFNAKTLKQELIEDKEIQKIKENIMVFDKN